MSWLNNWFGGNQEKSAGQQQYNALAAEVYPWEDQDYDPNDPRNAEMERKQTEMVNLHYKLHPEDRELLGSLEDVNVEIYDAPLEELGQAIEEKKGGRFR
jgi:hypothetical protein